MQHAMCLSAVRWLCPGLACALPIVSLAASLHVSPVRLVLSAARPVASMTLGNHDDAEVAVQAQVFVWTQRDGQDVYEPTRDVLVNPAIFRVPAKGQQTVRLGLQTEGLAVERSYRIFLQQLPRETAPSPATGAGAQLQTLLRIGVPIFVPANTPRHEVKWRLSMTPDGGSTLLADNVGNSHIQLTRVVLHDDELGTAVADQGLSQYLLPGQSAAVPITLNRAVGQRMLRVEATSDMPPSAPAGPVRVQRAEAVAR